MNREISLQAMTEEARGRSVSCFWNTYMYRFLWQLSEMAHVSSETWEENMAVEFSFFKLLQILFNSPIKRFQFLFGSYMPSLHPSLCTPHCHLINHLIGNYQPNSTFLLFLYFIRCWVNLYDNIPNLSELWVLFFTEKD